MGSCQSKTTNAQKNNKNNPQEPSAPRVNNTRNRAQNAKNQPPPSYNNATKQPPPSYNNATKQQPPSYNNATKQQPPSYNNVQAGISQNTIPSASNTRKSSNTGQSASNTRQSNSAPPSSVQQANVKPTIPLTQGSANAPTQGSSNTPTQGSANAPTQSSANANKNLITLINTFPNSPPPQFQAMIDEMIPKNLSDDVINREKLKKADDLYKKIIPELKTKLKELNNVLSQDEKKIIKESLEKKDIVGILRAVEKREEFDKILDTVVDPSSAFIKNAIKNPLFSLAVQPIVIKPLLKTALKNPALSQMSGGGKKRKYTKRKQTKKKQTNKKRVTKRK